MARDSSRRARSGSGRQANFTVTDTVSGTVRRYTNAQGQFRSFGDNTALGPQIGLAKELGTQSPGSGDSWVVPYTFVLENTGIDALEQVQLEDDLSDTFADATGFSILSLSSDDLSVNPAFNGTTDMELLLGSDTLALGESGHVALQIQVNASSPTGPYENSAVALARNSNGFPTTDLSQDGVDPDPDADGDPGNNSDPTTLNLPTPTPTATPSATPSSTATPTSTNTPTTTPSPTATPTSTPIPVGIHKGITTQPLLWCGLLLLFLASRKLLCRNP